MMAKAIRLPGGGVSKVNIATDLELAFLGALGRGEERMTNEECKNLSPEQLTTGGAAVERMVVDKITNFLGSANKADEFRNYLRVMS
jgi:fructose/tagatose bisphosphate aldolase